MNIGFYTYDLCAGRENLMPWRTILEVAKFFNTHGHNAIVINACYDNDIHVDYKWENVEIKAISVGINWLGEIASKYSIDSLFVPFTWRDGLKNLAPFSDIHCRKIAYMAGGVYDFYSAWYLLKEGGLGLSKPYFLESIAPKRKFTRSIKNSGFDTIIGLTEYTANCASNAGFNTSIAIYPGKDEFDSIAPDYSIVEKYNLKEKKWLLFSGAPIAYRGAGTLIKAIDKVHDDSLRVVLLMRADAGKQYLQFFEDIKQVKHPERILIVQDKVSRAQLRAFFGSAYYMVLPFIIIPSEVPLTYFEVLSCGTPVVTYNNGGTTKYMEPVLEIAPKSIKGLAKSLEKIWADDNLREARSARSKAFMELHPSWQEVGALWLKLIENK